MSTEPQSAELEKLRAQLQERDREIAQLHEQINQLTLHDPLTGVLNRRSLMQALEAELQRSHRTAHPFSFAIIDLDHLGRINDQFGAEIGNLVLKRLSDCAVRHLRALDRFGRLGGGAFGVMLPATWIDQGLLAMNRLAVAEAANNWEGLASGLTVTFSAGLTTNAPMDTAQTLLARAEKALRQAKQEGRNRLVQIEQDLPNMEQESPG